MTDSTTPPEALPPAQPIPVPITTLGLTAKDVITFVFSSLALLVSLSTFVVGRLDAAKLQKKEMHQAYWLGQHFWGETVFWIQAASLRPAQRKAWFQDPTITSESNQVQQLSTLLDLGFTDTHQLFPLPDSAMTLQEFSQKVNVESPFLEVVGRISVTHSRRTQVAFGLGYLNLQIAYDCQISKGDEMATRKFIAEYPARATVLNQHLAELGISKPVSTQLNKLPTIFQEMATLRDYLNKNWLVTD